MTKDELRAVLPGGKHHEVAKAWAASDDAVLQWRLDERDTSWHDYERFTHGKAFTERAFWRIKPKTLRYRAAERRASSISRLHFVTNTNDENWLVQQCDFVKWLGDWVEVEV